MNNNWHCELCNHQRKNLREGSICNLTKRKPDFNRTCSKKLFSTKFKNRLREVNVVYQHTIKDKWWNYSYTILFGLLGVGLFGLSAYSLSYVSEMHSSLAPSNAHALKLYLIPFIIFGVALKVLSQAIGMYNMYILKTREAKLKKDRIDAVLELYHITYDLEIDLHPNYRSPQDAKVNLEVHNLR
ncbi:hypothetical protein [uncultured Dokdonia sp.]|uniref:hypothetical protein n=1 Tax=uncultured Dokdonia sp. TaxID=575653 RepID=UPI0030EB62A1